MLKREPLTLASHYTCPNILRQCLSPIMMMLFSSIYGIVDGIFISVFDGPDAFAGVNLIFPLVMIVGGLAFMFSSGGAALTSKFLGEKKNDEANRTFSMMIYFSFIVGIIFAVIGFFFVEIIVKALASNSSDSTPLMIEKATIYGRIMILGQPIFMMQDIFKNFLIVDEKPKIGFLFTFIAGITNIVMDAILVGIFKLGVIGAAAGTIIGYLAGAFSPIIYFLKGKNHLIHLVKTKFDFKIIGKCSFNGVSDFIFNISSCIIGTLFNIQCLRYIGQSGVTAYGVIMYVSFIFISIFIGFVIGMAPVIGYNFGAKNKNELNFVIKNILMIFGIISIIMTVIGIVFSKPLAMLFCHEEELIKLSQHVMIIYSFSYLFAGFGIFITGMFTALNNGLVSGIISIFRSLIFPILFLFTIPLIFNAEGIWISIVIAEMSSGILSFFFLIKYRKEYTVLKANK